MASKVISFRLSDAEVEALSAQQTYCAFTYKLDKIALMIQSKK